MAKHAGGRPLLFDTPLELQTKISKYFAQCDPHVKMVTEWVKARSKTGKLSKDEHGLSYLVKVKHRVLTPQVDYTITDLAVFLNTSRQTLINYEAKEEFFDTIKGAKDRIEAYTERKLHIGNPTGSIFSLKNNYGWSDKSEVENTGDITVITRNAGTKAAAAAKK